MFLGGSTSEQVLLFTAALLLNWSVLPGGLNGVEAASLTGPLRTLWKENAGLEQRSAHRDTDNFETSIATKFC